MTDNHVHIGQFHEVYYKPLDVLDIVTGAGVEHIVYSSTTSGKDGIYYKEIESEIMEAVSRYPPPGIVPFFWYIPSYIDEGISPEAAFQNLPYGGIKLHPRAHRWDLENNRHLDCLHSIFSFCRNHGFPILIHTGEDDFERPRFFEQFIAEYCDVHCILAHCRPVSETIEMFRTYKNVYGDTAFLSEDSLKTIIQTGFDSRLIPGSDFPITHYFRTKYPQKGENPVISLQAQYAKDIQKFAEIKNMNLPI